MPTTSKITLKGMAAENIDSDQYVDGSIDEAHIANDAVNFATHLKAGTDGELITWDASGNPAAVPVGTDTHVLTSGGTGVAPTFQVASGGDVRNFIIDGDFTQWPEGATPLLATSQKYGPALWKFNRGGAGAVNITRSTDVPTFAQSGHTSIYSMLIEPTTADASLATSDHYGIEYFVTGSDYTALHSNIVTLSFWHKHTKTGIHSVSFQNNAVDRSYPAEYTQSTTNTWERATITITLDTTGTWLFTEADKGLKLIFNLGTGTDYTGTPEQWNAANDKGSSNIVNDMDNTSNNFAISQVGLYLGSTAPTFLGEPVSTVQNQVDYYVQRYDFDSTDSELVSEGMAYYANNARANMPFRTELRAAPTITSSAFGTFVIGESGANNVVTSSITYTLTGRHGTQATLAFSSSVLVVGHAVTFFRNGTNTCFVMADARH